MQKTIEFCKRIDQAVGGGGKWAIDLHTRFDTIQTIYNKQILKQKLRMTKNYLFGCDWGTSSFRLRLMDVSKHTIIGEVVSNDGISTIYNAWKARNEDDEVDRQYFFREQLQKQINRISEKVGLTLDGVPVIISGMASSSIGMEEMRYAELPFSINGSKTQFRHYASHKNFSHHIILISGVKSDYDVMRGEETELIGLLSLLHAQGNKIDKAILIFPGTHSKHLYVAHHQLINFHTYMTGEIFHVMGKYSILQNSVDLSHMTELSGSNLSAFRLGVHESRASNILNSLFSVRVNQLFHKLNKKENAFYLSGLLIGSEMKSLCEQPHEQLILCSGSHLFELYQRAMAELGLLERTMVIPAQLIDQAAMAGQLKIFQQIKNLTL
ncbi:2-dehydro-3-deoxygalactonokinase [Olivibacter ginsenosidimutans]